jgi:hypothetical protein
MPLRRDLLRPRSRSFRVGLLLRIFISGCLPLPSLACGRPRSILPAGTPRPIGFRQISSNKEGKCLQ